MAAVDKDDLVRDFEAASRGVKRALGLKNGGGAAESIYSEAFQRLAENGYAGTHGTVVPLRPKYRR